jgi:hypothetical protein
MRYEKTGKPSGSPLIVAAMLHFETLAFEFLRSVV